MLDLLDLEQLVAFADYGTLSKAAEKLHLSQPTITRTMKRIEDSFGVPLFVRGKNKIAFNKTGEKAVEYARALLTDAENIVQQVQAFDRGLHTITVESCAPAPLWLLLPSLSKEFPNKTISSKLAEIPDIIRNVSSGICEIGILPYSIDLEQVDSIPIIQENLSVCIPKDHDMAKYQSLTFEMLNGFNCLLKSQIGFWNEMCHEKMPSSRFLVQTDEFEFEELVKESALPCFTTNLVNDMDVIFQKRTIIPITDPEANVTYHLIYASKNQKYRRVAEKFHVKK